VTYIGIYEDRDISVGIFIIRCGRRIPLHTHPGMHGLIKESI
jgi:cysteamine dioxygenase